ncbi:hypothetical protein F2P81_005231 [Scophthalmus maximus]|uniref:Uncharacterized protein n=1 Tax=Scophthalmus maximus TaxID=52904 RepID=A0A6A4TA28_SCOMX|nr:hypothetical protein F2P81_005231 [Scophthalmus maximus]
MKRQTADSERHAAKTCTRHIEVHCAQKNVLLLQKRMKREKSSVSQSPDWRRLVEKDQEVSAGQSQRSRAVCQSPRRNQLFSRQLG